MNGKTFFIVCIIFLCIFLAGILVGATIGTKTQKEIDRVKIEEMTEENLRVLERVENLQLVLDNTLRPRRTKDIVIAKPGTGD